MTGTEITGLHLAEVGAAHAVVRWRTEAPSDSRWELAPVLDYGVSERADRERIVLGPEIVYERRGSDPGVRREHEIRLEDLQPGFGYYLRVRSGSRAGPGPWKHLLFSTEVPVPGVAPSGARLKDFLIERARELDAAQKAERAAIDGPEKLRVYQQKIRDGLISRLGGLPEKTPLEARTLRVIDRGSYVIENVVFESLPHFYVPGNLYVPKGLTRPAPAVLGVCGHSVAGKSEQQLVQMANVNLARRGFVTLQIDPPGQNEMGWDGSPWTFADMHYNGSGHAHHLETLNAILLGQSLTRYFLWDGIRAVDYLSARREVDPARIGIWGCSGGGGQSLYVAAIDERVKAALCMSMIYDTTAVMAGPHPGHNRRGGESFLTEETFPLTLLSEGLSYTAVAALIAPRALVLEIASRDAQPVWCTQLVYRDLKGIYDRLGYGDRLSMAVIQGFHCSDSVRQLVYWTFDRELGDPEAGIAETDADLLPPSVGPDGRRQPTPLDVALHSSMVEDFGSETVHSLLEEAAAAAAARRPTPASSGGWFEYCREVRGRVRERLRTGDPPPSPKIEAAGEIDGEAWVARKLSVEAEAGLPFRLDVYSPKGSVIGRTVLFVRDRAPVEGELPAGAEGVEDLLRGGRVAALLAVRGSGEKAPLEDEVRFGISTHETRRTHDALAVGRPLIGQYVLDILAAIRALEIQGHTARVALVAEGAAALWSLFAAVLSERVGALAMRGCLVSYGRLVADRFPTWIQGDRESSVVVPGALEHFDLPDLVSTLAPRPVRLSGLVDAQNRALPAPEVERECARARERYDARGARGRLEITDEGGLRGWAGLDG